MRSTSTPPPATPVHEGLEARIARLELFRFVRALGGFAQDGDRLLVALRCASLADLAELMRAVGVPCRVHEVYPEQPVLGRAYPAADMARFPSLVGGAEERPILEQPGHCALREVPVFAWALREGAGWRLELSPVDAERPYAVTERCVAGAEALEPWLLRWADRIIGG